jgi:hypothetical protein
MAYRIARGSIQWLSSHRVIENIQGHPFSFVPIVNRQHMEHGQLKLTFHVVISKTSYRKPNPRIPLINNDAQISTSALIPEKMLPGGTLA